VDGRKSEKRTLGGVFLARRGKLLDRKHNIRGHKGGDYPTELFSPLTVQVHMHYQQTVYRRSRLEIKYMPSLVMKNIHLE